ncbi:hypothetical protein GGH94_005442 [Coemansia aciculifera]|uniref:Uncharacterized protein n=1 Tax=Coemansia aciculifera TaxID=417176 RepID=A0A9W8M353_9FUNG|nr:hypothetical protein GGH94_005442 [Coemansia aciculifera]KAJ2870692.1 hypothetical protein GGH93_005377 [Coemansia aciculifera]KAJ2881231.1 hypothetical protein H4R27_004228 [Coemansia aciculifera]
MKFGRLAAVLLLVGHSLAWSMPQKIGIYTMIQKLTEQKVGSAEEHVIYAKLAIFFGDMRSSAKLSHSLDSPQFRDALFSLLTTVSSAKVEAVNDPAGVDNLDYLIGRIRKTYGESLRQFWSH